jgi:tRNA(Arg) A34 adenosine deaminase TadA
MRVIPQGKFMRKAISEAKAAYKRGDYPIGACIVKDGKVIASAGNRGKTKDDSTRHPELELIQYVVGMHSGPYIEDCVLYTTHEPCPMCSGACVWSKIGGVVYGNSIDDFKVHTSTENRFKWRIIDTSCREITKGTDIQVLGPYMQEECGELFQLK